MRIRRWLMPIAGLCLSLSLLLTSIPVTAEGSVPGPQEDPWVAVAEKVQESVVGIITYRPSSTSSDGYSKVVGTGIVISDGYVVTNAHVINGAAKLKLFLPDGTEHDVDGRNGWIHADFESDIAVIQGRLVRFPAVTWGDSVALEPGQPVMAIGNPLGFRLRDSVTTGVVSTPVFRVPWNRFPVILTDAAINPGNSGGPLVNLNGQVVGINTRKSVGSGVEGLGYVLPSNQVQQIVGKLLSEPKVTYVWDGLDLSEMAESQYGLPTAAGLRIGGVFESGPASSADLQVGDIITHIDNVPILSLSAYYAELDKHQPRSKVVLKRKRGEASADVEITLVGLPNDRGYLENYGIWSQLSESEIDYAAYVGQYFRTSEKGFEADWGYTQEISPEVGFGFLQTEFAFIAHHIRNMTRNGGSVDYETAALLAGVVRGRIIYTAMVKEQDPSVTATLCQNEKCWDATPGPVWPAPSDFVAQGRPGYRMIYVQFSPDAFVPDDDLLILLKDKGGAITGSNQFRSEYLW